MTTTVERTAPPRAWIARPPGEWIIHVRAVDNLTDPSFPLHKRLLKEMVDTAPDSVVFHGGPLRRKCTLIDVIVGAVWEVTGPGPVDAPKWTATIRLSSDGTRIVVR